MRIVIAIGLATAVLAVVLTALAGPRLMTERECVDVVTSCAAPFPSTAACVVAGTVGAVLGGAAA